MSEDFEYPKRSSAYPYISLPEALERLDEVYKKDNLNFVPIRLLHERWGYKQMSSSLKLTVAALGYYGLIDDVGSGNDRKIRINNIGHRIIKQAPGYEDLIKAAATKPKIFNDIWMKYRKTGLPQNDVIHNYLVWELGSFTDKAANHIVNKFSETIEYANLEFDYMPEGNTEHEEQINEVYQEDMQVPVFRPASISTSPQSTHIIKSGMECYNIPLIGNKNATIYIPRPLSLKNHEIIISWLNTMKAALVEQNNLGNEELNSDLITE